MLVAMLVADVAHARGYRIDQVPGGFEFECYMCHFRRPFTRQTAFGVLVRETLLFREDYPDDLPDNFYVGEEGNVDWATIALIDSDGDGYTNGEELGDAMGLFVQGDPQPDFPFTRPDLADEFPCGSGTLEGPEACDGEAFGAATCADFDFPGGALRCRDDCTIDPVDCNRCGDGVLDPDEACDGAPDAVCPPGFVGEVRCVQCRLDEAGCIAAPDATPDMAPVDAAVPDAAPDAAADAAPDAGHDGAWDTESSAPDTAVEAAPDAMPDVMPDVRPDAGEAMDAAIDGERPPAGRAEPGCSAGGPLENAPWPGWFLVAVGWIVVRRRGGSKAVSRRRDGVASA